MRTAAHRLPGDNRVGIQALGPTLALTPVWTRLPFGCGSFTGQMIAFVKHHWPPLGTASPVGRHQSPCRVGRGHKSLGPTLRPEVTPICISCALRGCQCCWPGVHTDPAGPLAFCGVGLGYTSRSFCPRAPESPRLPLPLSWPHPPLDFSLEAPLTPTCLGGENG